MTIIHPLPRASARGTPLAHLRARILRPGPLLLAAVILPLCLSQVAFAGVAPPPPDQNASAWLQALYTAVTNKQWGIVAGVALIGLVYPLRLWGPNFVKTPLGGLVLAFVVSLAGTLGITFAAGASVSIQVVIGAITTAATAAGLWEWIKTHLPGGAKAAAIAVAKNPAPAATSLLVALVMVVGPAAFSGCAAPQRTETLQTAQIVINATAAGMLAYDRPHQDALAVLGTPDQAAAALKAYRAKRAVLDKAIIVAADALIAAARLNDQPSADGLAAALTEVLAAYKALKGPTP